MPTDQQEKAGATGAGAANGNGHGSDEEARRAAQALADEQAAAGAAGEEDDGQLFVMEDGVKLGLSSLVQRGTPVNYEFKMESKGVKGATGMGLISFGQPKRTLVVPGRAGKIIIDPSYDADGNCVSVTVRQHFKPAEVHEAGSERAQAALGL